jgi:hypothetical protein
MAQGIAAVGRDTDFQHDIGVVFQHLRKRGSYGGLRGEEVDSVGVRAESEFYFGAEHAFGEDAAERPGF